MKPIVKIFFLFLIAGALLALNDNKGDNIEYKVNPITSIQEQPKVLSKTINKNKYQTQTKSFGNVDVDVTPEQLKVGERAIFSISINTHSVDLDYDFTQITSLTDNNNNIYNVISWGGGKGGHHLKGMLTFDSLQKKTNKIFLNLSGIEGLSQSFEWGVVK